MASNSRMGRVTRPAGLKLVIFGSVAIAAMTATRSSAQDAGQAVASGGTVATPLKIESPAGSTIPDAARRGLFLMPTGRWECCAPDGPGRADTLPRATAGPRSIGGALRFRGDTSALSLGVVGTRDYRLPLFMSMEVAGAERATPALSALTDMSRGAMTWQVVGSVQRTLYTSSHGATVSAVGDVFLPVGSEAPSGPHNPTVSSRAVRFGLRFGF